MSKEKISVVVADDHELITTGLEKLLADIEDINLFASVKNGKELLGLFENIQADVVLMDVDMPEMDGIEATIRIKKQYPSTKIIALTVHKELGIITKLKDAGIDGYLLKNITQDELAMAIRKVYSGSNYYSTQVTDTLINSISNSGKAAFTPEKQLTEREIEILKLIAMGFSNTEIGEKLFISHRTVDTHRTNLMKKLQVNNIAGLIRFAFHHGLVE